MRGAPKLQCVLVQPYRRHRQQRHPLNPDEVLSEVLDKIASGLDDRNLTFRSLIISTQYALPQLRESPTRGGACQVGRDHKRDQFDTLDPQTIQLPSPYGYGASGMLRGKIIRNDPADLDRDTRKERRRKRRITCCDPRGRD